MTSPPPPKAKPASEKVRNGFQALAANEQKMEAIRRNTESSKYYDGSSPATRQHRERARSWFEAYVQASYNLTEVDDIWSSSHFIQRTKEFLEGVVNISKGQFEEKIQTRTLWGHKYALYWWASVLVKDFHVIWHKWHSEVNRHILMIAAQETLSKQSHEKNNLSDSELMLIFGHIREQRYGLDNLKQHWAAMLLVWYTAVRPGSITVGDGYQKGAPLGLPGKVRDESETLRWSDVEFVNMTGGIALRITFSHNKGFRDPHKSGSKYTDAKRAFTFLPSMGERLEFDLPLILLGIAYQRGLFTKTLDEILAQDQSDMFLEKNEDVNRQAIFVAALQSGQLDTNKPMLIHALNQKLQQLCREIGLMHRNTYYSLRRTAIIEVRRMHGTAQAKDIAYHTASSQSLFYYDNVGFGDVDMHQFRLGGPETMTRSEIRNYFSQSNTQRWQPSGEEALSFDEVLCKAVKAQLHGHKRYIDEELKLKDIYNSVRTEFQDRQMRGEIPDTEKIPTGTSTKDGAAYKALSYKHNLEELIKKIEAQLATRKRVSKNLRLELRNAIAEDMRKKHRPYLTEQQKQPRGKGSAGASYQSLRLKAVHVSGRSYSTAEATFAASPINVEAHSEDDDAGVDEDALEQHDINSREEPACWEGLNNEVHVQVGGGETTTETTKTREEFLMMWIRLKDTVVAQSDLLCPRCQVDPTIDKEAKARKFTLSRLNTHMRGATHKRDAQVRRAVKQSQQLNDGVITCPVCGYTCKSMKTFFKHLHSMHPEQLWEDLEEDVDAPADVTDFEGFSDIEKDMVEENMGEMDFEEFSSPMPAYTGKGKGRAA